MTEDISASAFFILSSPGIGQMLPDFQILLYWFQKMILGCVTGRFNYCPGHSVLQSYCSFHFAWQDHAYPADELMPLSCKGRVRGVDPSRGDVDDALGK